VLQFTFHEVFIIQTQYCETQISTIHSQVEKINESHLQVIVHSFKITQLLL